VQERVAGQSKWSTWSLVKYAVNNITSFTTAPLHLVTGLGIVFLILAVVQGIECLTTYLTHRALEGFTTVILMELILGSIVMISLGIIGGYVGKMYEEVKGRHRYIVSKTVGIPNRRERHDSV
jgi:dolichol-phosphate mannosyltransferase